MRISIIIPVHNNERTISKCLDSFLNQEYEDLEIICIDDHSVDRGFVFCKEYEKKYKNVICKQLGDQYGVSNARNVGLSIATGDIIGFSDADDYAESNSLAKICNDFEKNDVGVIVYAFNVIRDNNVEKVGYVREQIIYSSELIDKIFYDSKIGGYPWNKFFLKRILKKNLFNSELIKAEDLNFIAKTLNNNDAFRVLVSGSYIYNYVQRNDSVSHKKQDQADFEYIHSLKDLLMNKNEFSNRVVGIIHYELFKQYLDISRTVDLSESEKAIVKDNLKSNFGYYLRFYRLNFGENTMNAVKHAIGKISPLKKLYRKYRGF